ncbi:DUF4003 family protein [Clostridium paridis]|uniref:DUF4003 family protein n=1 Tax=Clostridium paridis TaxID=2803863 RepID=A0A937FH88_9CLOT|nr:DUF4003 family protein [Clostridium paridis]MBL4932965.1 DUF4003 family protein [Clostridium paridis]
MDKVRRLSNIIIDKYNRVKLDLRFDGEYLNYFAALLEVVNKKDVNTINVKNIRKYFSKNTPWHSSFRGTGLYIVSLLISLKHEDYKLKVDELIKIEEELISMGYKEGGYLALACYILSEYGKEDFVNKFHNVFIKIQRKNSKITWEEDYPIVALMVAKEITLEYIEKNYNECFNLYENLEAKSSNITQDIVNMSLIYNEKFDINESIIDNKFEHQYAILYPLFFKDYDKYTNKFERCQDFLEEHTELQLFMDKSFRKFLSFALVIINEEKLIKDEICELIAICIFNFTKTQEMSILSELT